ncbi:MAG: transcriptional regulator [Thermoprotei archaeon]|nr:MAG: transcriptional regulator [Thermoprotei archaeon]
MTYNNQYLTLRERIMKLLMESREPLSVDEIAAILGLSPRDKHLVYDALTHIAKTIKRRSGGKLELVMIPPTCKKCGYVFKDLKKPRKPSRCPRCKSERINPPLFKIISK